MARKSIVNGPNDVEVGIGFETRVGLASFVAKPIRRATQQRVVSRPRRSLDLDSLGRVGESNTRARTVMGAKWISKRGIA